MGKTTKKSYIFSIYLVLAIITFTAFEPIIHNEFISFDDGEYILNNSYITSGLTLKNISWAFTHIHSNNYHPVTSLSHMLDCQLYGTNPGGHHFTNLLFHIGNTLLLFSVFNRMTKNLWASAFITALFALHPLHVESVAWASERKDVLSAFFWILTLLAYVCYVEHPAIGRYLSALLMFALGLLSKSMLVTLPFVLLLLDYWPLNRLQNTRSVGDINQPQQKVTHAQLFIGGYLILEKIPFLALSAILSMVTFLVQRHMGLVKMFSHYPLNKRIENAVVSYVVYIEKMFWPANLAIFYPHPQDNIPLWQIIVAASALIIITSLALWKLRQRPYIAVGWLWFFGTLVPVIGIIQVGLQAWADRYTYITYIGLFIIITWGISDFFARLRYRKVILSLSAVILLSVLGVKTYFQIGYWHDNMTLYKHATEVVKDNWWAHSLLATELVEQNKMEDAVIHFKEVLRLNPQNPMAKFVLARILFNKGQMDEAVKLYQKLLPPLPDNSKDSNGLAAFTSLLAGTGSNSQRNIRILKEIYTEANFNLGAALAQQGNFDEAVRRFTEVLQINPDLVMAHRYLGNIFLEKGNIDEAVRHYTVVLQTEPNSAAEYKNLGYTLLQSGRLEESVKIYQMLANLLQNDWNAYTGLGIALSQQGKLDEAISCFNKAVSIEPNSAEGYANLGNALSFQGKANEAIDCFNKAVQLDPNSTQARYNLARILIEQGEAGKAITHLEKVIELKPDWPEPASQLASILVKDINAPYYSLQRAIQLAEQACKLTDYKQPELLGILASVYAADGKYPQAVETAKKALDLAQSAGQEQLKNEIERHLRLYEVKRP